MTTAISPGGTQKVCSRCGVDVSRTKRVKTAAGQYFCEPCFDAQGKDPAARPAVAVSSDLVRPQHYGLVGQVTCPHCWNAFSPDRVLWVSQHSELLGDPVLGKEKPRCFLPSRFTVAGEAIDLRGVPCQSLACPRCHLHIPRSLLEMEPLFFSIIGGPKSGKSYFLASMTWEMRRRLQSEFALVFSDADTLSNQLLNEYEATLFLPDDSDQRVAIRKTELEGDLYDQVALDGRIVSFPRPFLFNLRLAAHHPNIAQNHKLSRLLCMYDNAGEHFQPGMDRQASPVTQHLARSKVLMFLFDPTQDPRFRERCRGLSSDPQLVSSRGTQRQETLLVEAGLRIRRYANLPPHTKHTTPLLVLVSKSDVWEPLLEEDVHTEPIIRMAETRGICPLDVLRIERISDKVRSMLMKWTPELVAAAEDFCDPVVYIPISALGCSPEETPLGTGEEGKSGLFVRPRNIAPRWAPVPILYSFAKWAVGLVANNDRVPGRVGS